MPILLLLLFSVALSVGTAIVIIVIRRARGKASVSAVEPSCPGASPECLACFFRPACWLAVQSRNLVAVQFALGLHNAKPCSWLRGLAGDEKLFIAPPVKGWILVMGSGLPDPSDDVDACYRFLTALSRKLGHVQFFSASRVLQHHAWVQADGGRVLRAYAWAGKTLWQQGRLTPAEKELDLRCFDYNENPESGAYGQTDVISTNVEKVPLLAARWSLDPAHIDGRRLEREQGIAGDPSRRF
jgi:hypothetical protein